MNEYKVAITELVKSGYFSPNKIYMCGNKDCSGCDMNRGKQLCKIHGTPKTIDFKFWLNKHPEYLI